MWSRLPIRQGEIRSIAPSRRSEWGRVKRVRTTSVTQAISPSTLMILTCSTAMNHHLRTASSIAALGDFIFGPPTPQVSSRLEHDDHLQRSLSTRHLIQAAKRRDEAEKKEIERVLGGTSRGRSGTFYMTPTVSSPGVTGRYITTEDDGQLHQRRPSAQTMRHDDINRTQPASMARGNKISNLHSTPHRVVVERRGSKLDPGTHSPPLHPPVPNHSQVISPASPAVVHVERTLAPHFTAPAVTSLPSVVDSPASKPAAISNGAPSIDVASGTVNGGEERASSSPETTVVLPAEGRGDHAFRAGVGPGGQWKGRFEESKSECTASSRKRLSWASSAASLLCAESHYAPSILSLAPISLCRGSADAIVGIILITPLPSRALSCVVALP